MEEVKKTHPEKEKGINNSNENLTGFKEFIDLLPEVIYETNTDGFLTIFNEAGEKLLGYSRRELSNSFHISKVIIPEEREMFIKNREIIKNTKKSVRTEYHAVKKDGTVFPIIVHTSPIYKKNKFCGTRGVLLDITERKSIENNLKASNDFLNTTINAMQEPFFVKDENHQWIILNDAAIKMWGHNREELIGKSDFDIFPEKQAEIFWKKDDFVFKNGSNINIEEITDRKGEIRTIVTSKVLYQDELTGKKYIVGTSHDITDLRLAEIKLKEYSAELEELNKNKDKLFSIIAHDLRNPFTSIYGFTRVLFEEFDTLSKEEVKEYINYINTGTKSIYELIENLLTWSRIQTGSTIIQPVKLNLRNKVNDAINLLNVFAQTKGIKLLNEVADNVYVLGDNNMVDSVIQNILSNAIKFTKSSGFVKVYSSLSGNFVEVYIEDNGVGISEKELDNLFKLGKQNPKTGTFNEQGTGLGLILCKEMITKLNGKLEVKSEINKGTIVHFSLPAV